MTNSILAGSDFRRFKDQMQIQGIGPEGQLKLKNAHIAVVGAGGTGTAALQYLSALGVGNFTIIDDGLVDESNIQRQTLYGGTDLGKLKSIITRLRLQTIFPLCNYDIINLRISDSNAVEIFKNCDIVVDSTNNTQSAIVINDACIKAKKPWVYCFVQGTEIELSVFNYLLGPSLRCLGIKNVGITLGSAAIAYGIAGNFIATEILKMVTGMPDILSGKLMRFNISDYSLSFDRIVKKEENIIK
jgi:adenylyltransferase/sulfurtransferase